MQGLVGALHHGPELLAGTCSDVRDGPAWRDLWADGDAGSRNRTLQVPAKPVEVARRGARHEHRKLIPATSDRQIPRLELFADRPRDRGQHRVTH